MAETVTKSAAVRAAQALALRCGATVYFAFCDGGI
jgi:hypothetical protein